MIVDLHTHTTASDGALDPVELLERARSAGVRYLAITDHDTLAGYRAAAAHYTRNSGEMRLFAGIEFSCCWGGTTVHICGLGMQPDHPALLAGESQLQQARQKRAEGIAAKLANRGYPGALEGALAQAGSSQVGRPHFAAWMVEQGHCADLEQAFSRYLGAGKVGDIKAYWPELSEVVQWIVEAGGVAVIAHPIKYRFTGNKLRRLIADFQQAGGTAMEVFSGRQTRQDTEHLLSLACSAGLEVSIGSDFHRDMDYGPRIGVDSSFIAGQPTVWQRLEQRQGELER